MANEITVKVEMQLLNGLLYDKPQNSVALVDQAVAGYGSSVISVAASEEDQPTFVDVPTPGMCRIETLETKDDGTETLSFGPKSGGAMVLLGTLKPGDPPAVFRLGAGVTLRFIATGAMKFKLTVYND